MTPVPSLDEPWWPTIGQFALSYDGYGRHGDGLIEVALRVGGNYLLGEGVTVT